MARPQRHVTPEMIAAARVQVDMTLLAYLAAESAWTSSALTPEARREAQFAFTQASQAWRAAVREHNELIAALGLQAQGELLDEAQQKAEAAYRVVTEAQVMLDRTDLTPAARDQATQAWNSALSAWKVATAELADLRLTLGFRADG